MMTSRDVFRNLLTLLMGVALIPVIAPRAARADVREAVQRAAPATVVIERRVPAPASMETATEVAEGDHARTIEGDSEAEPGSPNTAPPRTQPGATGDSEPETVRQKQIEELYEEALRSANKRKHDEETLRKLQEQLKKLHAKTRRPVVPPRELPETVNLTTGSVISSNGLIVTVGYGEPSGEYLITFPGGRKLPARVLVVDQRTNLQLLKVDPAELAEDAEELEHLDFAENPPQLGETVVTVWARSPRDRIVSRGIIAAHGRAIPGFGVDLLQTDLNVKAGAAGAPLVDESGKLVGVIAATQARDIEQGGPAFAVPVDSVRELLEEYRDNFVHGKAVVVSPGFLGVQLQGNREGAPVIGGLVPGSPADDAGLRKGDRIVAIGEREVNSVEEVLQAVRGHRAGEKVRIKVLRTGEAGEVREVEMGVRLDAAPVERSQPDRKGSPSVPQVEKWSITLPDPLPYGAPAGQLPQAPPIVAPAIRVERSDVEQRLNEIQSQIRKLQEQNEALMEQLKQLQSRLDKEEETP